MTVRKSNEESAENEEDLQAWCLLEESENEQWQEVYIHSPVARAFFCI